MSSSFCQAKAWHLQGSVSSLFLADGRETLRFGLGAPDDDDETDEMEDEERAYAGWG